MIVRENGKPPFLGVLKFDGGNASIQQACGSRQSRTGSLAGGEALRLRTEDEHRWAEQGGGGKGCLIYAE